MGKYERIGNDINCLHLIFECLEGGRDIFGSPDLKGCDVDTKDAGHGLNLAHFQHGAGITGIGQDSQPAKNIRLAQEFNSLSN
jgi:hypothetical protein